MLFRKVYIASEVNDTTNMRRIVYFGVLIILMIYLTGCLYPPEPAPAEEKVEPIVESKVVELPPESITEPQPVVVVEENKTEENKTKMNSSEFTVNPTLDNSAMTNSS